MFGFTMLSVVVMMVSEIARIKDILQILRSHVMVRVGGGWDTLQNYLDKHDPCRCRRGHRSTTGATMAVRASKSPMAVGVTYDRYKNTKFRTVKSSSVDK